MYSPSNKRVDIVIILLRKGPGKIDFDGFFTIFFDY